VGDETRPEGGESNEGARNSNTHGSGENA
jgi:hypothetical protein